MGGREDGKTPQLSGANQASAPFPVVDNGSHEPFLE